MFGQKPEVIFSFSFFYPLPLSLPADVVLGKTLGSRERWDFAFLKEKVLYDFK